MIPIDRTVPASKDDPTRRPARASRSALLVAFIALATVFPASGLHASPAAAMPAPEAFAAPTTSGNLTGTANDALSYRLGNTTMRFDAGSYTLYRFSDSGRLLGRRGVTFKSAVRVAAGRNPVLFGERHFTRINSGSWQGWYAATPAAEPNAVVHFAQPLTVQLGTTSYAGVLFYANSRISTRRIATLSSPTSVTASKRATFGTRDFVFLTDGPLADRWVSVSSIGSVGQPPSGDTSSGIVTPPADTVETTTWKTLVLIYRETDVTFTRSNGSRYRLQAQMSSSMYDTIVNTLGRTASSVNGWSGDLAAWSTKLIDVPHPMTNLQTFGTGYWVGPDAVAADLDRYAPAGTYDSIVIIWQAKDASGVNVPVPGWGLTLAPGWWANGAGFSSVITGDASWWDRPVPQEVFVHEWMHQVLFFQEAAGRLSLDLHAGARYGYTAVDGSWKGWLSDVMQGRVRDGGSYIGVSPALWRAGTPSNP